MVEQNPLLQRRQRIDILDVGRTSGYLCRDRIDFGLRELNQRQHVRRDGRASLRNQVIRR